MKQRILSLSLLFLFSFVFQSCQKDNDEGNQKPGTVEFSFSAKAPSKSGAQQSSMKVAAETKTPAFVIVTIKSAAGKSVYTKEKIELFNMNGSFISKPLSLLPSGYTLEEFLVADAGGNIIYAAPLTGSKKAYLVSKPLPINFSVKKDEVVKLVPEVLSTENATAEDFGYTTFGFAIVKTFDFLMGVFVYNETIQNFELTNSSLTVSANDKVVFSDTLKAITNQVSLPDGFDKYVLTVKKDGYNTYVDTLTAAELKLHFKSEDLGPLKIILTKGSTVEKTITMVTDQTVLKEVKINLKSNYPLTINWGDGSVESINGRIVSHKYTTPNQYTIKISGEIISSATLLDVRENQLISINLEEVPNLIWLGVENNKLSKLDVSKNTHLEQLFCSNNVIEQLNLSENKELKLLWCIKNKIAALNVSSCTNLEKLLCSSNIITSLDVNNNKKLVMLWVNDNKLTKLDLSNNLELNEFVCYYNPELNSIDVTKNTKLESLHIGDRFTSIDISKNTQLRQLFIVDSFQLTNLDITNNKELRRLDISRTALIPQSINNLLAILVSLKRYSSNNGTIDDCTFDLRQTQTPISGQGLTDLNTLRDTYKWKVTIYPQ